MLTDEEITKFQLLYKNRFGEEISREEAIVRGEKLIRLVRTVYQRLKAPNITIRVEAQ